MASPSSLLLSARRRADAVRASGHTIYDSLLLESPELFFRDDELEVLLAERLLSQEVSGPIRSRSKVAKQIVAEALGYEPPASFKRINPGFPGQDLDVHVQVSDNLQIWNQEVSPERRYVLIRPDDLGIVRAVKVVRGQQVAQWDRTGTLTSKFQAKRIPGRAGSTLVTEVDTIPLTRVLRPGSVSAYVLASQGSGARPEPGEVLSIAEIYNRALALVGTRLPAVGAGQDRVRGEQLQEAVTSALGVGRHDNHGQWPDLVSQALEVKLQTSPTIDLGLVLPTDTGPAMAVGYDLRHCDARYLVAYGEIMSSGETGITEIVVSTGAEFFDEFVQFGGLVTNSKRQIPLPSGLFEA